MRLRLSLVSEFSSPTLRRTADSSLQLSAVADVEPVDLNLPGESLVRWSFMPNFADQHSTCVVVYERQPYWGPELQRQFSGSRVVVRECRSLRDLLPITRQFAASVVLLVIDAAPADCLTWFSQHLISGQTPPVIVIASTDLADLEWPLREAGAAAFINDEIGGAKLARLCLRQLSGNRMQASVS